jgi:hypothetical protein
VRQTAIDENQAFGASSPAVERLNCSLIMDASPGNTRGRSIATLPAWQPILPAVCPSDDRAGRPQAASASASIIVPSVSIPAARQNRSKYADTSSHALGSPAKRKQLATKAAKARWARSHVAAVAPTAAG